MEETLKERFERILQDNFAGTEAILLPNAIDALFEAYNMALPQWVDAYKKTPDLIKDKRYSENVYGVCDGMLGIYCYCLIDTDDGLAYVWANCYNDIDGDGEFDEDYDVTHWMPLPTLPTPPNPKD